MKTKDQLIGELIGAAFLPTEGRRVWLESLTPEERDELHGFLDDLSMAFISFLGSFGAFLSNVLTDAGRAMSDWAAAQQAVVAELESARENE